MNKIKLAILSSLLTTSIAYANTPCNGFEIKLKNNLADDLLVTSFKLNGAHIQPGGLTQLKKKSEENFTVNDSNEDIPMTGEITLHTITLPTKEVKIKFDLKNKGLICEHSDHSPGGDLSVNKSRLPGKVEYTINN